MKYIRILLLFSILISFRDCKKKGAIPEESSDMSFRKDGVKETFTPYYCSIQRNNTLPGETDFFLVARSKDNKSSFGITIQVTGNFTTGLYETKDNSGYYPVIADYFMNQGEADERDYAIDNAPGKPGCQFSVKITSIDDKFVKGSFSGNYLYDRNYNESIVITEGNFVAKRH